MKCAINVLVKHEAFKLLYKHLQKKNILTSKGVTYKSHRCFDLLTEFQKSSAIFGCKKNHALKTQNGEVIKSRLADLEEVKEWYHIATWLDLWNPLVGIRFRQPTVSKVGPRWKKRMNPFFLQAVLVISCLCHFI